MNNETKDAIVLRLASHLGIMNVERWCFYGSENS